MTRTAKTFAEAQEIEIELRGIHRGTDWKVSVVAPLFEGDLWRITVE